MKKLLSLLALLAIAGAITSQINNFTIVNTPTGTTICNPLVGGAIVVCN